MVCGKPERALTADEVADLLDVSVADVRGWIRSGELRARPAAGQDEPRVRQADLERFLRTRETAADQG